MVWLCGVWVQERERGGGFKMDVAARSQPRQTVVKDVLGERVQKMFQDSLKECVNFLGLSLSLSLSASVSVVDVLIPDQL